MIASGSSVPAKSARWYIELNAGPWRLLAAGFLGWVFDGYETYALFVAMTPALRQLLPAQQLPNLSRYAGVVVASTLLGWAAGGAFAGIFADYFGRKRTMMFTIVLYAVFTGLTAFVYTWPQMAACRFLTGLGLGGEWATGVVLIAESWPSRSRAKGQGIMQSAFGWGALLAAGVWYFVEPVGHSAWRFLFLFGVIPGFFILYIRRHVHESEKWKQKHAERKLLQGQRSDGMTLSRDERNLADFTVSALFSDPRLRRPVLLCMVMSLGTTLGYWAISSWLPAYVESVSRATLVANPGRWAAAAGLLYSIGGIVGLTSGGFLADIIGRRALLVCYFGGSFLATPLVFLWAHNPWALVAAATINGVFTSGQFTWMAIYPSELFPTAVRCTAVSLIFNTARFISFLGPLLAGFLITRLGGYSVTALFFSITYLFGLCAVPFLAETRGKPLPA